MRTHPIITLTLKAWSCGKISPRRYGLLFIYYFKILFSLPFDVIQQIFYGNRIRKTVIDKSPVFIIGHYRSGTTLMHKLLAGDTGFGFISNFDILFPGSSIIAGRKVQWLFQKFINVTRIKNFHFNNVIHKLDEPGEEDMMMMSSCSAEAAYWGFVFPHDTHSLDDKQMDSREFQKRWKKSYLGLLRLVTYRNRGKRLVLKNPPNTGRIALLLEMFPDAKFVYVHRNAFHLFYSMKNLWTNVISKYYSLQSITSAETDDRIFNHYEQLISKYESTKHLIPAGNLVEISYEDLEEDPYAVIREVYASLGLESFDAIEPILKSKIGKEKEYRKFSYKYDQDAMDKIHGRWSKLIMNRNYHQPVVKNGITD